VTQAPDPMLTVDGSGTAFAVKPRKGCMRQEPESKAKLLLGEARGQCGIWSGEILIEPLTQHFPQRGHSSL